MVSRRILGNQYDDVIEKLKDSFRGTVKIKCEKCGGLMERDDDFDLKKQDVFVCYKCNHSIFVERGDS